MELKSNYLKYWRVAKHFIKTKYELTQSDLDMLLFLHDEVYFSKDVFVAYSQILPWDKLRFYSLKKRGWIIIFRARNVNSRTLYALSTKAKSAIGSLYDKLNGGVYPTSSTRNPMFKTNVPFTHKVHRNIIKAINADIKAGLLSIGDL